MRSNEKSQSNFTRQRPLRASMSFCRDPGSSLFPKVPQVQTCGDSVHPKSTTTLKGVYVVEIHPKSTTNSNQKGNSNNKTPTNIYIQPTSTSRKNMAGHHTNDFYKQIENKTGNISVDRRTKAYSQHVQCLLTSE